MEAFGVIVLAVLVAAALVAFYLVLNIFFGQRIERTRQVIENSPGRAFVVGLVNFAFFAGFGVVFLAPSRGESPTGVIGLVCLVPPAFGMLFGLAAVMNLVSDRLAPQSSGIWRAAWGTLAVALACALPFIGWFGMLPFLGLLGLGAFILSLFSRKHLQAVAKSLADAAPDDEAVPPVSPADEPAGEA